MLNYTIYSLIYTIYTHIYIHIVYQHEPGTSFILSLSLTVAPYSPISVEEQNDCGGSGSTTHPMKDLTLFLPCSNHKSSKTEEMTLSNLFTYR